MKSDNQKTKLSRTAAILSCIVCAAATCGLFNSCAYTETMNQREAEGQRLQKELGYEIERGRRLSH